MEKKELEKINRKITKLVHESKQKILALEGDMASELISFAKEYNQIWKDAEFVQDAHLNSPEEVKRKVPGNADSNHVEHVGASSGDSSNLNKESEDGLD